MAKVKIYNVEGKQVGEKELRDDVFGVVFKPEVVHEVVVNVMANARHSLAHTKTRGEVSGGGKKPWKQKGTGRARHGSIRSPIWIGGGITFGPRNERDYSVKINRKTKRQAMLMVLSGLVSKERLVLVDSFGVTDGKTKEFTSLVGNLPFTTCKKFLAVSVKTDSLLRRSTGNLSGVTLRNVSDVSLLDILNADCLLMTPDTVETIEKKYAESEA